MTKDRKIRRANIPKEAVVYKVVESFKHTFLLMLISGGLLITLKVSYSVVVLLLVILYSLLLWGSKVVFELRESFMLAYRDKEFATIIYYDEIINYQIKVLNNISIKLIILTYDELVSEFILSDKKLVSKLNKVIGEKQVGK